MGMPGMVLYSKGLYRILAALPGSRSTDTAERQAIHPGWPAHPGHGLRSDDGMVTSAMD